MTKQGHAPELHFAVIAADTTLFTIRDGVLLVRLAPVNRPPHFPDTKGLPGGLIHPGETADEAAVRHLEIKGGVSAKKIYIEQLYTFSSINRDPRGRVVAVAYLALVPWQKLSPAEQEDTKEAWWSPVRSAKKLAYDHDEILSVAVARLQSRVTYTTLIAKLMPDEFTLTELENAYETILETDIDKRNFRKKILKIQALKELPRKRTGGRSRPAQLYQFASKNVLDTEVI